MRDVRLGTNASPQKDSPSRAIAALSLSVSHIEPEEKSEMRIAMTLYLRTRARVRGGLGHVCVLMIVIGRRKK